MKALHSMQALPGPVTGTPGVGKSWFLYYLLARLLKNSAPPPFIVWEHMTKPGKALDCLARIVLLTAPQRETFKEMRKEAAELLYMPLWKLDELLACRSRLYGTVDEALAKELYQHYGGVARFVLQRPEQQPYKGLDELLKELREAVAGCDTEQMRSSIGSISTGPEDNHTLLHIVADKAFRMQHLVFASQWVADEFAKKAMSDERQGGSFTVAPIDGKTLERQGNEEVLVLGRCTRTEAFKDLQKAAAEHVYYSRPLISPTFKTVDALERGEKTCDFFQMTVGSSKELDSRKLDSLLNDVQLPVGVTPHLHFVVPEDSYPNFKLKAGKKNWPPKPQSPAFRMKLYIMKGVYARLQVW
ncbi:hypothetical protein HXX76_014894 [Chlamydomonas incerta]|uniref:Uncharacterized protein n=1 Tax=Chlamydomonas incerta TaxID=51695 RepID=A0A835SAY7_CHLIN|nr:hypothetical protein HXX76_014894 [Chlamydomonas incerta]|eukprot:KAG2423953.1 hypothetical protein HXX76_014894 [Chlamydomonas incerta]